MYLIAGLGNPGEEYAKTRHNTGFMVLDLLSHRMEIPVRSARMQALTGRGAWKGEPVLLCKPQTYMNDSGAAIRPLLDYYRVPLDHLIVVYDDIDLPLGKLRVRGSGSAGTHNGMRSILLHTGSGDFPRVRVGIGRPARGDLVDFVLGRFSKEEQACLALEAGADAVLDLLENGVAHAQAAYN